MKKKEFSLLNVIVIVVIVSIISGIASGVIVRNNYKVIDVKEDKELNNFIDVYSRITRDYYEDIDKGKMLDGAVEGMLKYLDDSYTTYLDNSDSEYLNQTLNGTFKGIGVTFLNKTVIDVIDNSPAKKAGLQKDDVFVSINDVPVSELNDNEIAKIIKEDKDDKVKIVVSRDNKEIEFNNVEIKKMANYYVSASMIKDTKIGYIKLPIFSLESSKHFLSKIDELENDGMTSLIIDLRGNTGGFLDEATNIASAFVEKGKILYSLKDKRHKDEIYDKTEEKKNYPIVILIDENSASASEILTSILKDNNGAILVGKKTYGKGKVQKTIPLKDGSLAKYTSSKWYRPNGKCIDEIGIMPDYEIELNKKLDEKGNVIGYEDTQLDKAVEIMMGMVK